jgi:superfamily II DNA or RNA helicase
MQQSRMKSTQSTIVTNDSQDRCVNGRLGADRFALSMTDRLLASAQRILDRQAKGNGENGFLRRYQLPAYKNFGHYLMDLATCPETDTVSPFCRIVLPPRTGKTVIAASLIQSTGLFSVFVVPTKALILQTAREFAIHLQGIAIGLYYGEKKVIVPNA